MRESAEAMFATSWSGSRISRPPALDETEKADPEEVSGVPPVFSDHRAGRGRRCGASGRRGARRGGRRGPAPSRSPRAPRCGGSRPIRARRCWTRRWRCGSRSPPPLPAAGSFTSSRRDCPSATGSRKTAAPFRRCGSGVSSSMVRIGRVRHRRGRSPSRSTRRRRSAPASTPRPAAASWRSTAWRGAAGSRGRSTSAPAAASWRSPRRSGCGARCWRAMLIAARCGSRPITSGATGSPGRCAWSARRATAAAPCAAPEYDLIFANILARPLALMARDLGRAIRPGGIAVLAGLLKRQEALVLAAHRAQGLALERRLVIEGWSTLILRSGR